MHTHVAVGMTIAITTLVIPIATWTCLFSIWAAQRANGRRAVEAELRRLRERAVTIENVPLHKLVDRAGLVSACVFRVAALARDGSARTHLWAYEPGLAARFGGHGGLKRLAHGIWIPA